MTNGSDGTSAVGSTLAVESAAEPRWDVVVVGAGPAGATAARELARRRLSVLLVDKAPFPRWKVCGCCLNGAALAALSQVGLGDLPDQLGAVRLTRWQLAARAGRFTCSLPAGLSVSRAAFDARLVDEAVDAGATFLPETRAELSDQAGGSNALQLTLNRNSQRETMCARVVVSADGLGGMFLGRREEFAPTIARSARVGAGAVLDEGPDYYHPGTIFMAAGRGGYVGLVRLEDGRIDVAAAFDHELVRDCGRPADAAVRILEESRYPLPNGILDAPWRGTPALTRKRLVAAERIFVIGDSAGFAEPFTGEGIAWALQSAIAVAPLAAAAVAEWAPEHARRWKKIHHRLVARRQRTCGRFARMVRSPSLTNAAISILAHAPWLIAPLVWAANASAGPISAPSIAQPSRR